MFVYFFDYFAFHRPEVSLGYSRDQKSLILCEVLHPVIIPPKTSSQAPSYASPKLSLARLLTGVRCRATSVAKKLLNLKVLLGENSTEVGTGDGGDGRARDAKSG